MKGVVARTVARPLAIAAVAALSIGCADNPPTGLNAFHSEKSSVVAPNEVADRYIILFRGDVPDPTSLAQSLVAAHGGTLGYVFQFAVKGFSVSNLPGAAVEVLRRNPVVRAIERVQSLKTDDVQQLPFSSYRSPATRTAIQRYGDWIELTRGKLSSMVSKSTLIVVRELTFT